MRSGRVLALCLSLFAANAAAQSTTDYDDDNDNLIDIRTLAQLNAIRYDLDGNGTVSSSDAANYTAAFTNRATGMGCAATCTGYELRQNLNFDTDGDEDVDSSDTGSYPNWSPIGGTYTATFEGNGFTISHLTIVNAPGSAGLFNEVSGTVRNLGVADANVSGVGGSLTQIGALAGEIAGGTVIASWASGQVRVGPGSTSRPRVGGLVGRVSGAGRLAACYSTVNVTGAGKASTYTGGLVGSVFNGPKIVACYATGVISGGGGNAYVGGLIGTNIGPSEVRASYFAGTVTGGSVLNGVTAENDGSGENYYNVYFDTDTTDLTGDEGQSTANLQRPTDASGIYANWDDLDVNGNGTADEDPWNFGTVNQYPVLNYGSHSTATQFTKQAPSYTGITVSDKDYRWGETITSFEIPPPTGGNGAYGYTVTGLPAGLVFDEDGTGDCMAARTVCGTPSVWGMATVTVIVADADGNTMNSDRASLTFTVTVAAPPLGVRVSPPRLSLAEGGSGAYTVVLSHAPTGPVTVGVSSDNPAVTVATSSLTFTTQNWNTARSVTVTGAGDADAVDEAATITNAASGGGYNGVSGFVRVGVADDEPSAGTDYDADNDGLIDVDSLAQLNAMRWDLDGDGAPSSGNAANYAAAFTSAAAGMGCPDGPDANQLADACGGYALTADLDFDTSGDGKVDADDEFASWTPIVGWDTMLDGRGHAISNLTVTGAGNDRGLFATATTNATVRALGLADVSVTGTGVRLGALAGVFNGRVAAVYATGVVRGAGGVAGLVAETQSTSARIVASYSLVAVECTSSQNWARAGGLAARNDGTITTSYAAGAITGDCPATVKGGLASVNNGTVTASYWDADQTGIADDTDNPPQSPEGLSSSAMWTPTAYGASASDVYNVWDEQDLDGDGAVDEDPWHFGGALNHPVLKWGGLDPADQRTNYDADGDRLIDIATLGQLNAVRWDLDGDGAPSSGNESSYWGTGAFFNGVFNPSGVGFCPTTTDDADDNDCLGYELVGDLDFDTDGDGSTWTAPGGTVTGDTGDAYDNAGAGWMSIGSTAANAAANYAATFDGNGHVIRNLFINRSTWLYQGLFAGTTANANITSLGLPNVRIQAAQNLTGGLVGVNRGRIAAVWTSGTVRAGSAPGGLVGSTVTATARVVASYSTAAVECTSSASSAVAGGLVGYHDGGSIAASYSTGTVTGACPAGNKGVFALVAGGTVAASYWDTTQTGVADDTENPPQPPEGRTTAALQAPTDYDAVVGGEALYADWDDQDVDGDGATGDDDDADPWDFGLSNQHPILKYGGLAAAPQLDAQPDRAPTFGTSTVANMRFQRGRAIQSFQVPAASAGNGVLTYVDSGLPAGLEFDADGSGSCPGNAPRMVCGTPTATTTAPVTVTITVRDADSNMDSTDEGALTFTVEVVEPSAAISSPAALAEATLNNATVTVALTNAVFESGVTASSFTLNATLSGLRIASLATVTAGDASATLTLGYSSGNFDRVGTLSVTVADSAHTLAGALTTPTVNIVPTPSVSVDPTSLSLTEGGSGGTYGVVLGGQPLGNVTVTATSGDAAVSIDSDATPQTRMLAFTPMTWNTAQTVTATPADDDDAEDESVAISHGVSPNYGATAASVSVTVDDDETKGIVIDADPSTATMVDAGPLALTEGAASSTPYTVKLASQPTGTVTVTVTSADATVATADTDPATGMQNTLSFTTTTWDTAQTVRLTPADDTDPNNEEVDIRHEANGGGYNGVAAILQATVADDDVGVLVDTDPNTPGDQTTPIALREGQTRTYLVRLSTLPVGGVVTVTATSSNAAITATPGSLSFNAGNWQTAQTVTVRAEQDDDAVGEWTDIANEANGGQYGGETTTFRATAADDEMSGTDYDADGDFLIEISSLAQLNAVRWDLDGDGEVDSSANETSYRAAFAGSAAADDMGCLDGPDLGDDGDCAGYELMADLDFDTDDDGDVDADDPNSYANWDPIGGTYTTTFHGNNRTISNLTTSGGGNRGLFAELGTGSSVSELGLVDVAVSSSVTGLFNVARAGGLAAVSRGTVVATYVRGGTVSAASSSGNSRAGGLVGHQAGGAVKACYATAAVSGSAAQFTYFGGLVGDLEAVVVASYATGAVSGGGNALLGGLVGQTNSSAAVITNSYATGAISHAAATGTPQLGGLVGRRNVGGAASASYWDSQTSGQSSSPLGSSQTTGALQGTTSATGTLYAAWDDYDTNDDGTVDAEDEAWDFGSAYNYPALKYGGLDPAAQRNNYDADGDGLIEISRLGQLDAVRWDLDGDGAPAPGATSTAAYFSATSSFFNARFNAAGTGLACPTTPDDADDNDCLGYELLNDLDFDTDGSGGTWTETGGTATGDANDAYNNGGLGWDPIGPATSPSVGANTHFDATFDGNGRVIENLFVNRTRDWSGLFAGTHQGARIVALGLPNARVAGGTHVGALAGAIYGRIAGVWTSGEVSGSNYVGGLAGASDATASRIVASYSTAAVECTSSASNSTGGGLMSYAVGQVAASYSTGTVTGDCPLKRGFASGGTVTASYWDTGLSGIPDDAGSASPEGKATADLQAPTSYDTLVGDPGEAIYATWDDQDVDGNGTAGDGDDADPWDFGRPNQHPILKYRGLAAAPQLDAQPDTAPAFATSTPLAAMTFPGGVAIQPFLLPTVTGGNGAYIYRPTGLPAGLSLGLPNCATARTLCGTPTAATSTTVTVTVDDGDSNMMAGDRDAVTFMITVPPAIARIAGTTPTSLMEANLDGATLRVELSGTVFNASISPSSFQLAAAPAIAGLSIASADRVSDTEARLRLRFDRTDFTARSTLLVRVLAAAHRFGGDRETGTVDVAPSGGVMLSATELTLQEAPGSTNANVGTYTVVLTGQPPGTATVTPASSNPDVTLSGALTFAATTWNTPQTVTVTAGRDDDAVDDAALIAHAVQGIPGVSSGPLVRVRVNDDDSQGLTLATAALTPGVAEGASATYTVRLASEPTGPVAVAISGGGGAVAVDADATADGDQSALLFHAMNWDRPQTVTVRAREDDDGADGSATLTHDPSGADYGELADVDVSFTVTDDDAKGADLSVPSLTVQENGAAAYALVLSTEPVGGPVSVAVASSATSTVAASPPALTFTAENWDVPQRITLSGVDDSNATDDSATVSHTPTGADYGGVSISDLNATVADDDAAGLKVAPTSLTLAEGATATYSVRLNVAPTATTTVTVGGATAKVTADADPNAPGDQTTLTFDAANWNAARTVRVSAATDADGADESVGLTHAVTGAGGYASVSAARRPGVAVRVEDAQTAGVVAEPDSLEIDEGGTATYQLRLSAPPASGTTTVTVAAAGAAGLRVATSSPTFAATTSLLFDAASWNAAQTVTVLAVADHDRLTDAEGVLTHAAANYGAVTAGPDVRVAVRNATVDHDPDADGLIDIDSLAKLNAVRWDLDGDGTPAPTATSSYAAAFPNPRGGGACPTATSGAACRGYELTTDLDFDTDGDGSTWTETGGVVGGDEGDDYYNGGLGWAPIGNLSSPPSSYFNATFRGNGHLVRNLFIDQSGASGSNTYVGFFGLVHSGGRIESLGLVDGHVRVAGTGGLLAGWSHGEVAGCYSTGSVVATPVPNLFGHNRTVGGLIGAIGSSYGSHGSVTTSYSTARATTAIAAGGLIGEVSNPGAAAIVDSYATGPVSHDGGVGDPRLGGLVGRVVGGNTAATTASYYDRDATGRTTSARGVGQSTADLQRPTGYDGIYAAWNIDLDGDYAPDDPWDFGTSGQYPSLKWGGFDPARQFAVPPPPAPAPDRGGPPAPVDLPPEALADLADASLDVGEALDIDLGGAFRDPEGGPLTHEAFSSDPGVASASAADGALRIEAWSVGAAEVTVTATDAAGLSASLSFIVRVGVAISFAADASAPEGGTIRLALVASRPAPRDLSVAYVLTEGGDPASAADASDHDGGGGGTVRFPAGAIRAELAIGIVDDDLAEPLREFFAAELTAPAADAGYGLGLKTTARATIEEGVCDRAAPLRDALRGRRDCAAVDDLSQLRVLNLAGRGVSALRPEDFPGLSGLRVLDLSNNRLSAWPSAALAGLPQLISLRLGGNRLEALPAGALAAHPQLLGLDLSGNRLAELPPGAFRGLSALRRLDLSGNLLAALDGEVFAGLSGLRWLRLNGNLLSALPAGLFAGVSGLEELQLQDNPGAPFVLRLELTRADGAPWAPGPASLAARVVEGAPFAMRSVLKASGGVLPEAGVALAVPAGAVTGEAAAVPQDGAPAVAARLDGAPPVPDDQCEAEADLYRPCFQGIATAVGAPLILFKRPPGAAGPVADRTLRAGDTALRLDLSDWFDAAPGETLNYAAQSSDPSALRARIEDGELVLSPLAEGMATVTVTATDAYGLSATIRFEVRVTRTVRSRWQGWRLILLEPEDDDGR